MSSYTIPHNCTAPPGNAGDAIEYRVGGLFGILVAGLAGFLAPVFFSVSERMRLPYFLIQAFAAGVVVATGLVHVLPDAIKASENHCAGFDPKFPWVAVLTLFSIFATFSGEHTLRKVLEARAAKRAFVEGGEGDEKGVVEDNVEFMRLQNYRVIAYTLEGGVVFHSVFVGLTFGTSKNLRFVKALTFALLFHQGFEGVALGGAISKAKLGMGKVLLFALIFAVTCPLGVALGVIIGNSYNENSKEALVTEVIFNSISSGILLYNGLVDLIVPTFEEDPELAPKSTFHSVLGVLALFGGGGCMSLIAKWA